jgi:type VI secretion system protein ImpG
MRDELLLYYDRELTFLRQTGVEFAEKYPKAAHRLLLEQSKCEDPHVERLLEAFAFLAARVHLKIDDEFPQITEALLSVVYPHFIRPIPSMSIVQFQLDPDEAKLTTAWPIPKDTMLYSRPVGGVPCKFRTCYDTTLWPLTVAGVEWKTTDRLQPPLKTPEGRAAIRVALRCAADVKFSQLSLDKLRFYIDGESSLVHTIYELLCCNLVRIIVRDPTPGSKIKPFTLPSSALRPVGFEPDEGMLPYPRRSFTGYRLLQEMFTFPGKFAFVEISGLQEGWASSDFKGEAEILFLLSDIDGQDRRDALSMGLSAGTFRLGCAPIVNLFAQTAEPILVSQQKYEYPIVPDVHRPNATEIFSIDEVSSVDRDSNQAISYEPFYCSRGDGDATQKSFWLANRTASNRANDAGTNMSLTVVDISLRPTHPDTDTLTIRTTCTNRDVPARLPFGSETGDFELEGNSPIKRIVCLIKPTAPIRAPLGKSSLWHLISHLSLNHLSIVEEGQDALKQILQLYNFTESPFSQRMIEGITGLKSQREFGRVVSDVGISFAKGWRVELELDEEQFVGGGVYLFASVIEHFLGQYASLNSFSRLVLRTRQRKETMREWPPRAGRRILM